MTNRWKYLVAEVKPGFWGGVNPKRLQEELDRQGSQGWELVQVLRNPAGGWGAAQLLFKKPG
jgi:hypothetical protein